MQIAFPFGHDYQQVDIPENSQVIQSKAFPVSEDPFGLVRNAIQHPIGCKPLERIIGKNSTVVVIVSDHTRYVHNELILQGLEPYLPKTNTSILIGGGLHEPPTVTQVHEILGKYAENYYPVYLHDAKSSPVTNLGTLSSGNPSFPYASA